MAILPHNPSDMAIIMSVFTSHVPLHFRITDTSHEAPNGNACFSVFPKYVVCPLAGPLECRLASSSDFKGPSLFLLSPWDRVIRVLHELMERKETVS